MRARNERSQGTPEEQSPHDTAGRLDVVQIGGPPSFRTLARSFVCSLACSPASIAFLVGIRVLARCVRVSVCDLLPPARPRTISKRHMCSPETSHVRASSCFTRRLRSLEIQHLKREVHSSTFKSSSCNRRIVDQKTLVYLKFLSNSTVHLFLMTPRCEETHIKNFSLLKTIS